MVLLTNRNKFYSLFQRYCIQCSERREAHGKGNHRPFLIRHSHRTGISDCVSLDISQIGGDNMHAKPTVRYICEEYLSGNKYYYKQEFLMEHKAWGSLRPVSKTTFLKRKKDGFKTEHRLIKKHPASIICLPVKKDERGNHIALCPKSTETSTKSPDRTVVLLSR